MMKFIVAAVWIAAAAIGSVIWSFQSAQSHASVEQPQPGPFGGLDYIRTEVVSVPLMYEGQVYGYFLGRFVYTVEQKKLATLVMPAEALFMDQLYTYLYANPQIDFRDTKNLDLDALRGGIRDSINARLGDRFVHEVLVEQIDFLSKQEIRDNTTRRRLAANQTQREILVNE